MLQAGLDTVSIRGALDAAVTWYVGRKALYPEEESPERAGAPEVRPATEAA